MKEQFTANGILLIDFSNGVEFEKVLTDFINERIKNIGVEGPETSETSYHNFADSTWFKSIKHEWIPLLIENRMIEPERILKIEDKINEWNQRLNPSANEEWYLVVAVVIIAIFIFIVRIINKKKYLPEDK